MSQEIKIKRGTRAQLESAKSSSALKVGEAYLITDENRIAVGTAVNAYAECVMLTDSRKALIDHTWTISGEIKVPSGDTDFICPMFVSVPSGKTVKLIRAIHKINYGTSVTAKLQKNGSDITGFTSLSVTTTKTTTNPDDVTLADGDVIALVVTAVSGTPKNLSFTITLEKEVHG
ncbi:MAG: hypothetical protein PHX51_07200 [Clostridia bacterium]|nr:hypothetical protein [Clostridia bacterium]